jgi:hypothetical protein
MAKSILRPADLFVPKAALSGPSARLFAGRKEQVLRAVDALGIPGTTAVVFGDRGVGKTSLAWHLFEILYGNEEVRKKYPEIEDLTDQYVCLWIECEARYENIAGLLLSLLKTTVGKKGKTIRDSFPKLFGSADDDRISRAYEFNIGVAKIKINVDPRAAKGDELGAALDKALENTYGDPFDLFGRYLTKAKEVSGGKDFIIFVDEFDRIPDRVGMGDFIKHCGDARTVIIGVAETPSEFFKDHPSSARKLFGAEIELPPLSEGEIREIFTTAEEIVQGIRQYKSLTFREGFISEVVKAAGGYPAIAQYIGYEAVRETRALKRLEQEDVSLGLDAFEAACRTVKPTSLISSTINLAIGRSEKRAKLLDKLADFEGGWVKLSSLRRTMGSDVDAFANNVDKLVDAGLVAKNNSKNAVKFSTPETRLFVLLARKAARNQT